MQIYNGEPSPPNRNQEIDSSNDDRGCGGGGTRSIYVSQPSVCIDSSDQTSIRQADVISNSNKIPVLTIQVNENIPSFNRNSTNLVNIVSCFRAHNSTITHSGIENIVQSNVNAPFSVSVNRSNFKCSQQQQKSNSDECNEKNRNQNIDNVAASSKFGGQIAASVQSSPTTTINHSTNSHHTASSNQALMSEEEKETTSSSDSSCGHHSTRTVRDETRKDDKLSCVVREKSKLMTTGSKHTDLTSEIAVDQTTIAREIESQSTLNRATNDNCLKSETNTFRDQRRRERRRERRRARNRAQHGHHHITVPVFVHHQVATGVRSGNVAEPSRTSFEILPDAEAISNHLPPPYTTLPQQQTPTQPIHSPLSIISPASVPLVVDDCRFSFPIPIIRRSPSVHSGRKGCCGQIFQSPKSLGLIAMIALGGVTCALGGAAWGASGLAGQPSTHLTISLLMIGIGVVLVTISGMAWKITTSESLHCLGIERTEFDHCGRQLCQRNNSLAHTMLCPEFQHRSPPPTYQASMQEYRLRLLLLDRDRQSNVRRFATAMATAVAHQTSTPPPTYRSNVGGIQIRSHRRPFLGNGENREVNTSSNAIYSNQLNIVPTNRSNENSSSSTHQYSPENVPIQQILSAESANQNQNSHHANDTDLTGGQQTKRETTAVKSNLRQNSNHSSGMVTIVTINNYDNENA